MARSKGFLMVVLAMALVLSACGPSEEAAAPVQQNPSISEAERPDEAVLVYMDCGSDAVPSGSTIAMNYTWVTQTEQQLDDYAGAVKHAVSVDGKPVTIKSEGYESMETTDEGYYAQVYWLDIGPLEPGVYDIVTIADVTQAVSDGWDWYGPDQDYTGLEGHCTLTVGEAPMTAAEEEPTALPAPTEAVCAIQNDIHPEWPTYLCETYDDGDTVLFTGNDQGTSTRVEGGQFLVDNSTKVAQGYTTGFIYPVVAGQAQDYMISVDGVTESVYKSTAWGVFVRSTGNEIVYFFMINNQGRYMLTGSSERESMRYLGNISEGSSPAIVWDDVNNITAVVEGSQMDFYVNGELVTSHEANDTVSPFFGLIVWGGEGVNALNRFDNLLVRVKD